MFGTGEDSFKGTTIGEGASAHYIMPVGMSGLCDDTYSLLGRENIRFRLDLEQVATAMIAEHVDITDADITLTNVVFYYDVMTLSDEQMK